MNPFDVEIPMTDKPLTINVKHREESDNQTFDLYYCGECCGVMFCNEHNIWIYEPHHHPALLLDEEHIKHLGHSIGQHTKC
ncbi:hypothetical protein [Mucilaginibacter ginkgonis]|uniref:Uncharacterized protein n=1 Tax=Mucilaginibacter ginkgonis TaxID=2682091 RepID=A0A6I4I6R7_9SPHI|nr:hypothetical protein [Mucilaginibacter ginkgonis]QQL50806.1 hypothetical protein GO620_004935 [Mucilaginibacter ginkgonis]